MRKTFTETLNLLLRKRGWNLAQLAKVSGISRNTLHGWTAGKEPTLHHLRKVAAVLEVSIHHLAFGERDPFDQVDDLILHKLFDGEMRITLHRVAKKSSNDEGEKL
ncbi:MAG: helix-turn-helix transcriptional regulator [Bdellovibrionales bacterium]|nr:helix-turn-helix transcriptional regulator [Bdellovibrionales bacterium]